MMLISGRVIWLRFLTVTDSKEMDLDMEILGFPSRWYDALFILFM